MPELPEVETVRRVLRAQLPGARFGRSTVLSPEAAAHPGAEDFCRALEGRAVEEVERRGKFLVFRLGGGARLVVHLRMTGRVLLCPASYPPERHTRAVMAVSGGRELRFCDQRRFGRLWLLLPGERDVYSGMENLGPEPFDPALTAEYLRSALGRRRRAVKECLMEQGVVAGIGNIYSDEILFDARIDPRRAACTLEDGDWRRLAAAIPERLEYFIEKNAITPEEYLLTGGLDYRNTPYLQVYGQAGEPCARCGETLLRVVIGGRSSVYCPRCQGTSE